MRAVLVAGGSLKDEFANEMIKKLCPDLLIAVDRGMDYFERNQKKADLLIGDLDSVSKWTLKNLSDKTERMTFPAQKDDTDLSLSIQEAIRRGASEIFILGATGGRFDHSVAGIQAMSSALKAKIPCFLLDEQNRIRLISEKLSIRKDEQYGTYVSVLAFTTKVTGVSLKGFFYPVKDACFSVTYPLGVSNEIVDDLAEIDLKEGILLIVESKDRESAGQNCP